MHCFHKMLPAAPPRPGCPTRGALPPQESAPRRYFRRPRRNRCDRQEIPQAPRHSPRRARAFSAPSAGQTHTCAAPRTFRRPRRDTRSPASHSPTGQDSRSARVRFGIPARYTPPRAQGSRRDRAPRSRRAGASREAASLRMPDSPPHKRNRPEKYTRFAARRYRLLHTAACRCGHTARRARSAGSFRNRA